MPGQRFNLGHVVGPVGPTGPDGKTGETGPRGAPGLAATVQPGAIYLVLDPKEAKVVNTGTPEAAVFDFYLPMGNMTASVYDPQGKQTDIFRYIDEKFEELTKKLKNVFIVQPSPKSSEEGSP